MAIDWARGANYPLVIKPDEHSNTYSTTFSETFSSAKKVIGDFFNCDTKGIVIENFVSGRGFSAYFITDGFNAFLLDFVETENNRFASLGAGFLDDEKRARVVEIASQTIGALAKTENNYVGILGMDFILGDDNVLYALEYNPFFDALDVELFLGAFDINWAKLFESAVLGTLKDEFSAIKKYDGNFATQIDEKGEVHFAKGRTLNEARENLLEEGLAWKF